jgi:Dolichyl-phosphate-mannose-protein mannosyltransferase
MRSAALEREPGSPFSSRASLAILAAATVAALALFLNKAFCVDDPLFLWAGRQIQAHPLDFYGCLVNWEGHPLPLSRVTKNPPLASYYIAAATALVGWSEPAVHAAFLLPAVGVIAAAWLLARRLCRQPIFAALAVLATPAFLVSSTNVMCDTLLLCFWTWSIVLWIQGLDSGQTRWFVIAGCLIAAAALTKYFAVSLIPLLAAYTLLRAGRRAGPLVWLAIPVLCLAGYEWWTRQTYGVALFSDAMEYVRALRSDPKSDFAQETLGSKTLTALSFAGGSFISVLFLAPWLWRKRGLATIAVLACIATLSAKAISSPELLDAFHLDRPVAWFQAVQLGLFLTGGVLVLWLALSPALRHRTADDCLLALWIVGTFVFAGFVNWTCNVRALLPLAPAFGIVAARRLDERYGTSSGRLRGWHWTLVVAAEVALMVTWADVCFANSERAAADKIVASLRADHAKVWFEGHWGFQYYMLAQGASDLNQQQPACETGDFVVVPQNNTNVRWLPAVSAVPERQTAVPVCPWLATMQYGMAAGFYSSLWGPLPFAFGPASDRTYQIWRVDVVQAGVPPADITRMSRSPFR